MQIDLINLFSKLSPPSGGAAPLAAKGAEGGFLAAILEMAGEMGLPPGELANLAAAPDGGALLERLARLANGEETAAATAVPFLSEIPDDGEIGALLPDGRGVPEEAPSRPVQETEWEPEADAAYDLPEDSFMDELLPPVSAPRPETPPPGPVLPITGDSSSPNPAEIGALETEAVEPPAPTLRSAPSMETQSVRPAGTPPVSTAPALSAAPESAEVLAQVGDRVRMILREGRSEIRMSLEPPELGSVRVHIAAEHGHVTVRMIAEMPAVRDVLENGLPQLRAGLESGGLDVDGFEVLVSDNGAGQPDGFAGFDRGNRPEADDLPFDGDGDEIPSSPSAPRQVRSARTGGIDYFA
ncbi:MAG: flagellar hook-length control protein FliK [Desulfococcaceae bacterium]